MAWISSGCNSQNSAICSKVREVFSTSHTAVALGINGAAMLGSRLRATSTWRGAAPTSLKFIKRYIIPWRVERRQQSDRRRHGRRRARTPPQGAATKGSEPDGDRGARNLYRRA